MPLLPCSNGLRSSGGTLQEESTRWFKHFYKKKVVLFVLLARTLLLNISYIDPFLSFNWWYYVLLHQLCFSFNWWGSFNCFFYRWWHVMATWTRFFFLLIPMFCHLFVIFVLIILGHNESIFDLILFFMFPSHDTVMFVKILVPSKLQTLPYLIFCLFV